MTRTFERRASVRSTASNAVNAALLAQYAAMLGTGCSATTALRLTIDPPGQVRKRRAGNSHGRQVVHHQQLVDHFVVEVSKPTEATTPAA